MAKRKVLYEGDIQILPMTHVDCIMGDEGKTLNGLLAEKANAADLSNYVTLGGLSTELANYATTDQLTTERERAMAAEEQIKKDFAAEDAKLQAAINGKVDQSAYTDKVAAIEKSITDEIARAKEAEEAAQQVADGAAQLAANNKNAIDKLNGADTEDGSVAKAVKDAQTALQAGIDAAEDRITVVEEKIGNKLDEITEVASKQALETVEKAVEDLQAEDLRLAGLIEAAQGDADAALDAIGDANKGLVKDIADLKAKDEDLQDAIDGKVAQSDYNSKVTELEAAHTTLDGKITAEANRADAAEKALGLRIDANKNAIDTINSEENGILAKAKAHANTLDTNVRAAFAAADQGLQKDIDAVEAAVEAINNEETGILAQAKADAKAKDDAVRADFKTQDDLLAGRIAALETFKDQTQPAKDQLQDEKIAALEELHKEGGVVDTKIAAVQGEVDALEGRMNTAEGAILAINNADTGILAQAKADAKTKDDAVRADFKAADDVLAGRIKANEDFVAAQPAIDKAQDDRLADLEALMGVGGEGQENALEIMRQGIQDAANAAANAQTAADKAQAAADKAQGEVDALEGVVAKAKEDLEGADAQLQTNIDAVDDKVDATDANLAKEVQDRKDAISGLKSELQAEIDTDVKVVADALAEEIADRAADEAQLLADAKKYANEEIAKVNTAAGNLELRVKANEDDIAEIVDGTNGILAQAKAYADAQDAAKDAQVLTDAKKYADDAVAALVDSAPEDLNTLKELAEAIAEHGDVVDGYVSTINQNIATAKQEAINAAAQDAASKDAALQQTIETKMATDIKAEADRAKGEEAKIRQEFAAADTALQSALETKMATDIKAEADRAKAEEADIRADFAAEDAKLQGAIDAINDESNGILALAKADAKTKDDKVREDFAAADEELQNQITQINNDILAGLRAVNVKGDTDEYPDIAVEL